MNNIFLSNLLFFVMINLCFHFNVKAQTQVTSLFSDHMVLQQNTDVKIWGKDRPYTSVKISTSWGEKIKTITNADGKWSIKIKTYKGGFEPQELKIKGSTLITINDILIGEVWLSSGQSNMQMPLKGYLNQPVLEAQKAIVNANNSKIRLLQVSKAHSLTPQDTLENQWEICTSATAQEFSAVAYFFGEKLSQQLGVPIGLINSARGATKAECWISKEVAKNVLHKEVPTKQSDIKKEAKTPTLFYNKMIHPLVGYTIKGVIWYQGEANRSEWMDYSKVMQALIESWRVAWAQGEFPFYMVEIAPFSYGNKNDDTAAKLREAQFNITQKVKNTGLVSTADLGDLKFIHPSKKKEIGERLSYWALSETYGFTGIEYKNPAMSKVVKDKNGLKVYFENVPQGVTSFGQEIQGFEVAGEDGIYYTAQARILKKEKGVFISSNNVLNPIQVRYAFKNYHEANLFSLLGLPILPFRTDDWNFPSQK